MREAYNFMLGTIGSLGMRTSVDSAMTKMSDLKMVLFSVRGHGYRPHEEVHDQPLAAAAPDGGGCAPSEQGHGPQD